MTQHLKRLGLALIGALAAGALMASAAQATDEGHFTVYDSNAHEHVTANITFGQEESEPLVLTINESVVACEETVLHGAIDRTTKKLTLEPTWEGACEAAGLPATVDENGCHLDLYTLETAGQGEHTWRSTVSIVCAEGKQIELTTFAGESHGFRVCTVAIPPQSGLVGNVIHSQTRTPAAADVLIMTTGLEGVTYTQSGLCGHEAGEAGLHGAALAAATAGGNPVDIQINHTELFE